MSDVKQTVEEIMARRAAASLAPWRLRSVPMAGWEVRDANGRLVIDATNADALNVAHANLVFCANAPTDIAKLLAALSAAQARCERLEGALNKEELRRAILDLEEVKQELRDRHPWKCELIGRTIDMLRRARAALEEPKRQSAPSRSTFEEDGDRVRDYDYDNGGEPL
jgi:hypothetical protein